MEHYPFAEIEPKWQHYWEQHHTFAVDEDPAVSPDKRRYVLDMFPYPSAAGLHVGHPEGYTATDIYCRFLRMRGYAVLHPMGFDSFGLPAENYAIQTGTHPRTTTEDNIRRFRRQIKSFGFSYDWSREVSTHDSDYYRWTQWIFLQLYRQGLAYVAEMPVWFCPALGTVLANEEVLQGEAGPRSERGNHPVERKLLKQWVLKITEFADELLDGLDELDWPESIKQMQRNWIGKSYGATVHFAVDGVDGVPLTVYTTRPDTLFGATFMVLAPEHPLLADIVTDDCRAAVDAYIVQAQQKSDLERTDLAKDKTGVFSGAYAINPVNGERIPIWVSDYVLISYGHGAIMAVPAHDERDYQFALKFSLPIKAVYRAVVAAGQSAGGADSAAGAEGTEGTEDTTGTDKMTDKKGGGGAVPSATENSGASGIKDAGGVSADGSAANLTDGDTPLPFTGDGISINNPDEFNGLTVAECKEAVIQWLEQHKVGERTVAYKLRDWIFSRQRYWGEPIPVSYTESGDLVLVDEHSLPLVLPEVESYAPSGDGRSPLAAMKQWIEHPHPDAPTQTLYRESNTMPQWAGSCWYYLRFIDPHNADAFADLDKLRYWLPVDLYIGGAEHAVLHLLYARFWHKVLYKIGLVPCAEPFQRLVNQGIILGENGIKMSKSLGNVVNPDELIARYGADSLRVYEMFMGPLQMSKPWNTNGLVGVYRFLNRVWRAGALPSTDDEPPLQLVRVVHKAIKKVTEDVQSLAFNTAIAELMVCTNHFLKYPHRFTALWSHFVLMLSAFAPHLGEELWQRLGHTASLAYHPWPSYDPTHIVDDTITVVIQINGKKRGTVECAPGLSNEALLKIVAQQAVYQRYVGTTAPRKTIVVPDKIVNVIV